MYINYRDIVNTLRNPKNYLEICKNETDTLKKCILCKKYLSSNQWSLLLEKFVKDKFHITNAIDSMSGDGVSINGKNIEIKISLGTKDGQFNFVQLRPQHNIDYYLILVYNMFEDELGKIYWFLCKPSDLYDLLPQYGGYAHGSISKLRKITINSIIRNNYEYSLRPNCLKKKTKAYKLWCIMKEKFIINENDIYNYL
jgi:hypothetical protein